LLRVNERGDFLVDLLRCRDAELGLLLNEGDQLAVGGDQGLERLLEKGGRGVRGARRRRGDRPVLEGGQCGDEAVVEWRRGSPSPLPVRRPPEHLLDEQLEQVLQHTAVSYEI
jgi:hypothetical protein